MPSKKKWDKVRIFFCDPPLLAVDLPGTSKGRSDYVTTTDVLFSFISHIGTSHPKSYLFVWWFDVVVHVFDCENVNGMDRIIPQIVPL